MLLGCDYELTHFKTFDDYRFT